MKLNTKNKKAWIELDEYKKKRIALSFSYDPDMIRAIKAIPGRRWNPIVKKWTVPDTDDNKQAVKALGFPILAPVAAPITPTVVVDSAKNIVGLNGELRRFQKEGVNLIQHFNCRALLADEMGLGKTVQAIASVKHNTKFRPALFIVPATLKLNWKEEIDKWLPGERVVVLGGRKPHPIEGYDWIIINYDVVHNWRDVLLKIKPQAVVCDECHYISNRGTLRSKAVRHIQKNAPMFLPLSGTPIEKPLSFFNILNMTRPDLFYSWPRYVGRYCDPKKVPWGNGMDYSGGSNLDELHKILKENMMIRRLKKDVLSELPEKTRIVIPLESNTKHYKKALEEFKKWQKGYYKAFDKETGKTVKRSKSINPAKAMVKLEKVKQAAVLDKMKGVFEWVDDFLLNNDKLVVFIHHKETANILMKRYKHIARTITGSESQAQKQKAKKDFQKCARCGVVQDKHNDVKCAGFKPDLGVRLLICSKSGKEGITLTAANAVAFIEFWWTPKDHDQAEDRVHRMGQEHDSVFAYYLVAAGTIEEANVKVIDEKRTTQMAVLDGIQVKEEELLVNLLLKEINR